MKTIVDFTRILSGPFGTQVLADLGHRVIKIEEMRIGDATRRNPPYKNGVSAYFFSANRGKESIVIDLKSKEGRELALDLVRGADAVVENFRPDVMDDLGLSYQELKKANPSIVVVSINGFGSSGPLRDNVSFDVVAQSMSGAMAVTSPGPDEEPIKPALALADLGAGLFGAMATLRGMLTAQETGRGCHLEVSLLDTMLAISSRVGEEYLLTGSTDNAIKWFPNGAFSTGDESICIAAYLDRDWQSFCRVLGKEDWVSSYPDMSARWQARQHLKAEIEAVLESHSGDVWLERLEAARVPAAPVRRLGEVMRDADLADSGVVLEIDHPVTGRLSTIGNPIRGSGEVGREPTAPPRHGQDTIRVLKDVLAMDSKKIDDLLRRRVVSDLIEEPDV